MKNTFSRSFRNYIEKENLFLRSDAILLAVSGGLDSATMSHLFYLAKFKFAIAHCNFHLRGKDSDKDNLFVQQLAEKYNVPFFSKDFDTTGYATHKGISIEMAAREQRYQWFAELLEKEHYKYIATAHHLDDNIETVFLNLLRGTGFAGLHGILPKQQNIIRPLLFASRDEIEQYSKTEKLTHQKDTTNDSNLYRRNFIRHEIIPVFKKINPAFAKTMQANIERFKEAEKIIQRDFEKNIHSLIHQEKEQIHISISKLQQLKSEKIYLFEILNKYGFQSSVVDDIADSLNNISGKIFYSPTHRLIKDREYLLLESIKYISEENKFLIQQNDRKINTPVKLIIEHFPNKNHVISKSKQIASVDFDKLKFPLTLRKWKKGDSFFPFGMDNKKKLSDFFIDQKFSLTEKENTWLLCSGNKIVWIISHRMDNRFRITEKTKTIYTIKWKQ